jgi:hypothetical protein
MRLIDKKRRRVQEFVPIFHGTNNDNMMIKLPDQTTTYNCKTTSWTTVAQAIKYKISPIKIAASNLIDESGL